MTGEARILRGARSACGGIEWGRVVALWVGHISYGNC
jgi:hypothetical protein